MKVFSLTIILLCAACAKQPAAKTPGSPPPTVEPRAAEPAPADEEKATPAGTSKAVGDPCSGGEKR